MGHVNNARYLTYVEIARVAYYEQVTGNALPIGVHGAEEGMILAEIRMTYRSPAFYGETLTVETRVERIGRTSFGMVHRITAPESRYGPARLVAVADSTLVSYDYREECPIPVPDEWRAAHGGLRGPRALGEPGPAALGSRRPTGPSQTAQTGTSTAPVTSVHEQTPRSPGRR